MPRPTVIVAVNPLPVFPAAIYDAGLTAHVASGRRNERAMTAGLKTLAYTDAVAALLEARRAGADEALFLDTEGHCSEATSSNLFVVDRRRTLVTPPVSCGALPGITRAAVLELARALGMPSGGACVRARRAARRRRRRSSPARCAGSRRSCGWARSRSAAARPASVTRELARRLRRARRARVWTRVTAPIVIVETIVTTVAEDGAVNCAPMGVEWGDGRDRPQAVPRDRDLPQRAGDAAPRS